VIENETEIVLAQIDAMCPLIRRPGDSSSTVDAALSDLSHDLLIPHVIRRAHRPV
jgi:hypothetical protein